MTKRGKKSKDPKDPKAAKKMRGRLILFFSLLIIVVVIVVLSSTLIGGSLLRISYLIGDGITGSAEEVTILFDSNDSNRFHSVEGGFAVLSVDGLDVYSFAGEKEQISALTYHTPSLSGGEENIVAYDRNGTEYTVMDKDEVLYSGKTQAPIINVDMNNAGLYTVVTAGPDCKALVSVYNEEFELLYKVHSTEQYILSAHVSEDGEYMITLGFSASTGQFVGKVSLYKLDSEGVFKSTAFDDCIPIDAKFMESGEYVVLCENKLVRFGKDGKKLHETAFDPTALSCASLDSLELAAIMINDSAPGKHSQVIVSGEGGSVRAYDLAEPAFDISCAGEYTAFLYGDRIVVYDNEGAEFHTFPLVQAARECIMRDDGTVFAVGSNFANLLVP